MLKGISPLIPPALLRIIAEMGHGDEIVISDAFFQAHTYGQRVIRLDGIPADAFLGAMAPLFTLDSYRTPVVMMEPVKGDSLDPEVERRYRAAIDYKGDVERMERYAFYDRCKQAYAVVITGERAKYGNVILRKGVAFDTLISPFLSPMLQQYISEMGHGDELAIVDAFYPGETYAKRIVRADGIRGDQLLSGLAPLFVLEQYEQPVYMMAPYRGDRLDANVEVRYRQALGYDGKIERLDLQDFYDRSRRSYVTVVSGETAQYGNVILRKGVTQLSAR